MHGLYLVGLEGGQTGQYGPQPLRLGDGYGVGVQRSCAVFGDVGDALVGKVSVDDHGVGQIYGRQALFQIFGVQGVGHVRVRKAQLHIPGGISDVEVRRSAPSGHAAGKTHVEAQLQTALLHAFGIQIAAQSGDEGHVQAQQPQVVGDVAPHAAHGHGDCAWIGVPHYEGIERPAADVDVYGAYYSHSAHVILLSSRCRRRTRPRRGRRQTRRFRRCSPWTCAPAQPDF